MKPLIHFGPLALQAALLPWLAGVGSGALIARYRGAGAGVDIAPILLRLLVVGIVAARIAFAWQYRDAYLDSPLSILDIRDGGWDPKAGLFAAWLYALMLFKRRPLLRKPLLLTLATTSVVWLTGSVILALITSDETRLAGVSLPTMDGGAASLDDFKGRPAVVNLWASWCPPCQREMPLLAEAQLRHPEFHFIFLNQGESAAKVRGFVAARAPSLHNVLLDPKGQASPEFSGGSLPVTLFLDAEGGLVDTNIGELSSAALDQFLVGLRSSTAVAKRK
jgi:thiol-disulfide isomerase/thioredoxin